MYNKVQATGQVINVDTLDNYTKVAIDTRKVDTWETEIRVTNVILIVHVSGKNHQEIATRIEPGNLVWINGSWLTNGKGSPELLENPDGTYDAYYTISGTVGRLATVADPEREDSLSVVLVGRLGAAPELKYLPDGNPFANFSLASDRPFKVGTGWQQDTAWFRLTAWGSKADTFVKMKQGQPLLVEVNLNPKEGCPRTWESETLGTRGASYEGGVGTFRFLPWKQQREEGPHSPPPSQGYYKPEEEEEIPF